MAFAHQCFLQGEKKAQTCPADPTQTSLLQWETPELSAALCVWKNRSSPHTRLTFQLGKNNFHPDEPQTTPDAPTTHRHAEARAKGTAQPRIHARLGLVGTEEGEMEKMGKLGVTEPGRVEQERNGETQCGPNLQISKHTAKLPVFTPSAAHSHSCTRRALQRRRPAL